MRGATLALLLCAGIATSGCNAEKTGIEGDWAIDLPPMLDQARSLGASDRDVQQVKDAFSGGRMTIDHNRITLTLDGVPGKQVLQYSVVSKDGSCWNLKIKSLNHRYCAARDRLEIHDPSTPLVAVYKRV